MTAYQLLQRNTLNRIYQMLGLSKNYVSGLKFSYWSPFVCSICKIRAYRLIFAALSESKRSLFLPRISLEYLSFLTRSCPTGDCCYKSTWLRAYTGETLTVRVERVMPGTTCMRFRYLDQLLLFGFDSRNLDYSKTSVPYAHSWLWLHNRRKRSNFDPAQRRFEWRA